MYVYVLCLLHVDGRNYVCLLLYIGYYEYKLWQAQYCVCVFVIEKHSHNSGLIVKKNIVVLVVVVCLFGKLFRNLN